MHTGCCVLVLWVLKEPIVILQQYISIGSSDNKKLPQLLFLSQLSKLSVAFNLSACLSAAPSTG